MKKLLLFIFVVLLLVGCNSTNDNTIDIPNDEPKDEIMYLMDREEYNDFTVDDIVKYELIRFTMAGDNRQTYTDRETIETIYKGLKELKIGKKTDMACEDNTTIYKFTMKDGSTRSIEIECDWVIIGKDRYEIVKVN